MNNQYKYVFESKSGKKHNCPDCGHKKRFVRYIDAVTGDLVAETVGKCDRSDSCGYHLKPADYFKSNGIKSDFSQKVACEPKPPKPTSFIDLELAKNSLKAYESNNFAKFLINHFGNNIAKNLTEKYSLGTSKRWRGANIFWQIDYFGNFRTGKIMVYDPLTGKRVKVPNDWFTWVHKSNKYPEFELKQCFFGENLLKYSENPIAICESEKTAMIASVYLPQFTWLATGGKEGINENKCQILNKLNRQVFFFPDLSKPKDGVLSTFEYWQEKAKKYLTCSYKFSDLLEKLASEADRVKGLDLADYLLKNKSELDKIEIN